MNVKNLGKEGINKSLLKRSFIPFELRITTPAPMVGTGILLLDVGGTDYIHVHWSEAGDRIVFDRSIVSQHPL